MIDTHAHLYMKPIKDILSDVVSNAEKEGVWAIINTGTCPESNNQVKEISDLYENVFPAYGYHPGDVLKVNERNWEELEELLKLKPVALGEIGLDYYWTTETRNLQIEFLERQLDLAEKYQLPVIFHNREANRDSVKYLKKNVPSHKGVFHCFSGDEQMLCEVLEMGFYIGIDGPVTYKKNQDFRELVKKIPLDRILLETDCPYLTPVPYRGKTNFPEYLKYIAKTLGEIYNLSEEKIEEITEENSGRLFGIVRKDG